jgi:hypothetical protein
MRDLVGLPLHGINAVAVMLEGISASLSIFGVLFGPNKPNRLKGHGARRLKDMQRRACRSSVGERCTLT